MKTKQSILKYVCAMGLGLLLSMSCSTDEDSPVDDPIANPDPEETEMTFAAVVANGGGFEEVPQSRTDETIMEGEADPQDYEVEGEDGSVQTERFICTSRTVSVLDGTGDFQTLGGAASEIYPGALLQGKTINNAKPQAIPLKRAGGSISYSLNDGNLQAKQDLEEMSESEVRQAMNNIISGSSEVVPADFQLTYENVFSEQQIALSMGLSYEGYGVKAEGSLSFSSDKTYNRILVKLNQKYYDVSYDFPTGYDDVFDESVSPEDLEKYIQPDNPATYIKKVTYGRIFYMLIESTSSLTEMNTQIEGSYKGFKNEVEANLEVDTMKKMENLKIKVIAYGGDSANTLSSVGETNVEALADMLAASTDIKTGLPLSYEIYSLEDPSKQVGTNISTEMEIVECELKGILPPASYLALVDLFEDGIGAATQIASEFAAIYNGAGTQYVIYNAIAGTVSEPYDIKDANGPMGVTSFDAVGAALRAFNTQIYVFNETGTAYEIIKYSSAAITTLNTPFGIYNKDEVSGLNKIYFTNDEFTSNQNSPVSSPINVFGSAQGCSEYPFLGDGIKAAVRRNHIADHTYYSIPGFTFKAFLTVNYYYSASSNGSKFSRLEYYNPEGGDASDEFRCWKPAANVSELRGAVEAACKVQINSSEILLYFTPDGRMTVRDLEFEEEGPWAL